MPFTRPSVQIEDIDGTVDAIVAAMRTRINDSDHYIAQQAKFSPIIGEIVRANLTAYNEGEDQADTLQAILAVISAGIFNLIKGVEGDGDDPVHAAIHDVIDTFSSLLHEARSDWRNGEAEADGTMPTVIIKTVGVGHA